MDTLLVLISTNAAQAHWWFFLLLILAGLNLPISEDLLIITSAVMAATVIPQNLIKLFIFVFFGCYFSDWLSYWMGRSLTPWMKKRKFLAKLVDNKRIDKVNKFYSKYGVLTLIIGRFIPFGVRNFLFMSAGMGRMSFKKFMLVDGVACLLSNSTLFFLAFSLAEHYPALMSFLHKINITFFAVFLTIGLAILGYKLYKAKKKKADNL
ncbi:MAG: Inner membrane protein [Chlamydiae bacterium]|nr:Inner membrane protein [Chlamydiota bacterium]